MKFKLFLLTTVVLLFATFSQAENCNAGIIDKAGIIRNTATVAAAARPLVNQGVDVRVVTVDHSTYVYNGSSLAGVETALEASCPNLIDAKTGLRKANLFVIMVAPQDRQKNIFLGSFYAGSFDIPSTYSQFANASFKAGQWETGIANTLNGTGNRAVAYHAQQFAQQRQRVAPPVQQPQTRVYTQAPVYTPTQTTQTADSSGMSGFAIFMVVMFVMLALAIILYFVFRDSSETTTTYTTPDPYVSRSASSGYPSTRRYAGNVPQTVVVNNDNSGNGLVTGMLIGEAMSRPNYNPNPVYVEQPVYVAPTPSYVPDPAPVADAPDSTWEEPTQQAAPDTNFETPSFEAPSVDPPSTDFGSSNDSGF